MRRALLDEQLPIDFAPALVGVEAVTVHARGWSGLKNGALLQQAVLAGFDVFVTMDRQLRAQQNVPRLPLGIVLVRARSNRLADLLPLAPAIVEATTQVGPGELREVGV